MADEPSVSDNWPTRFPVVSALVVCVPLAAGAVFFEMSSAAGRNHFVLTMNLIPFILGLMLGYLQVRDKQTGARAALVSAVILLALTGLWAALGTTFNSPYTAKALSHGMWAIPRM